MGPSTTTPARNINPEHPGGRLYPNTPGSEGGYLPPVEELRPREAIEEIGQSGTMLLTGYLTGEEYNPDLIGRNGIKVLDEMRKSDATVQASLKLVKLPLLAAEWDIQQAGDDETSTTVAEEVKRQLFDVIDFHAFLRESLNFLDFGFCLFEKVYRYNPITNRIEIFKLGSRKQTTILRWETTDGKAGITQQTYSGGTFSVPMDKLLRFTWEQEGDNYEGMSILRPAYKHWYYKSSLEKIQAMAIERQGLGLPMLTAPDEADEPSKELARIALRNLRANEQGYLEIPKGYIVDWMDMKGHTTIDPDPAIRYHDRQISKNVLGQFMELGAGGRGGGGGSHALSTDQSRLFDQQLEAVAKKFCEVINHDLIPQIVDFNFTGVTDYPKLTHGKIAEDDVQAFATAAAAFASADLLTPDPDLEQDIRSMLKVSDLPDEYREDYNNRPRALASTVAPLPGGTPPVEDTPTKGKIIGDPISTMEDLRDFKKLLDQRIKAHEQGR